MIDKVNEQIQKSLQPVMELASANTQALERLTSQQSALLTSLFEDSVSFTQGVIELQDFDSLVQAQQAYAEEVQGKISAAAQDAYDVISGVQGKIGEVLQNVIAEAQQAIASMGSFSK